MTSNMLAGERRWNARRSGMTVLGKVTVPKPLNLPSQRLENHGLDPSVEIVPKGTLGWGSRPSSSGSNAWVSSSVSPNADGGNTSPNHLSGRPSSGGSGTRPSTAGIDRTHEPVSAWGSNSRPSSASGTLASNQSSLTSLRPRSAETRPNSSQRSRFAEPVSESPVAWGPNSAAERLGVKSSKEDGFSLTSGDFPTLGSEKDNTAKNLESQDNSRPNSASERITPSREDAKHQVGLGPDPNFGPVNSWRNGGSRVEEDGFHPGMEKRQGEPQQFFNANIPPQHFDTWRGPPVNVSDAWYGGPPRGPAFGPPGASGGYPMEPYPYYRPQIPPALAGSQPIPPPGGGPRGPHPNNGELYRPHMPDSYARPGMPYRPGYFPGPRGPHGPMPFEGYYGPMGYCNNEREIPYMGRPPGPAVYNCYPGPNGPPENSSHGRVGGHAYNGKPMHDRMGADHLEDTGGPKRVYVKNRNERDQRDERGDREQGVQPDASQSGKGFFPVSAPRNYEWGADDDAESDMSPRKKAPTEGSSSSASYRDQHSDSIEGKSLGGMQNVTVDDGWTNKSVGMANFSPHMPRISVAGERELPLPLPPATKDPVLMQRIEGLNAKARASDGRNEALNSYNREGQKGRSKVVDQKTNISSAEVGDNAGDFAPVPKGVIGLDGGKQVQPMVVPRGQYHGGQGRLDHRGKGKFNDQDTDGWRRKPRTPEIVSAATSNIDSISRPSLVGEGAEFSPISSVLRVEVESISETYDSSDIEAQRVKRRELAKQRALQIQKEEDERQREQRARAMAKLKELDKRTQTGESATSDIQGETVESHMAGAVVMPHPQSQPPSRNLNSEPVSDVLIREKVGKNGEKPVDDASPHAPETGVFESIVSHSHTGPVKGSARNEGKKAPLQSSDGGTSEHKRTGYKQKQSSVMPKNFIEKSDPNSAHEAHKNGIGVTAADNTLLEASSSQLKQGIESNVQYTSNTVSGPSTSQRKKVNKSNKNKPRVDEPASPPVISDLNTGSKSIQESKATLSNLDGPISTFVESDGVQAVDASAALSTEETQSRSNNNWKSQPPRRMPRSQQGNRFTEKVHSSDVVWAPVRTQNRTGDPIETSQNSAESECFTKSDSVAQNSYKGKRAEVEGNVVPKSVAKEPAQHGSAPLVSSSVSSPFKLDESHWTIQFGSINSESTNVSSTGSNPEVKEGDARHSKPKKEHGHWKKRGTEPVAISESMKDTQQSLEQSQSVKGDKNLANEDVSIHRNIDTGDRSNMSNSPSIAGVSRSTSSRDQGAIGRGKKRMPVPRRDGNNPDHESGVETDKSSIHLPAPDVNHNDRPLDTKEQRNMGERSSHWKPKSHQNFANNHQINKSGGSQTVITEVNKSPKKDQSSQRRVVSPPVHDNVDQPQQDQPVIDNNVAEGSSGGQHQGFNREKKHPPAKGRSSFLNEDLVVSADSAPAASTGSQRERNMSGSRRIISQNNRYARPNDFRGDWHSEHDNRSHNGPTYRERQRHSVQYEYQPVGPSGKGGNVEKHDVSADRGNNGPQRYGERGQSHPKRGGSYYRREGRGGVPVESGHN